MFSSVIFFLADKAAKTRLKEFVKNRILFFHVFAKNRFSLVMFFLADNYHPGPFKTNLMSSSGPKGFKIDKTPSFFRNIIRGGPDDKVTYHPESTAIIQIFAIIRRYLQTCIF